MDVLDTSAFYEELERISPPEGDVGVGYPVPTDPTRDDLGRIAWEEYRSVVGGTSVNGDVLPAWEDIGLDNIREGWRQAAIAVLAAVLPSLVDEEEI